MKDIKPGAFSVLDVDFMYAYFFDTPHSFSQQCLKNLNIFDILFLSPSLFLFLDLFTTNFFILFG